MLKISQMDRQDDLAEVHNLLYDYLSWAAEQAKKLYNEDVDLDRMVNSSLSDIDQYFPPSGRLLLAKTGDVIAGMAFLKRIREGTCEIKRMYVLPNFRSMKIGRRLLDQLIQDAKGMGYVKILLDSAQFMTEAHSLYRSAGFKEIEIYPETEMAKDFQAHMIYMELDL